MTDDRENDGGSRMNHYYEGYMDALNWVQNEVIDKLEDREDQRFAWHTIQHKINEIHDDDVITWDK